MQRPVHLLAVYGPIPIEETMNRRVATALVIGAALVLGAASAHAGPCGSKIAQFETIVRQSANNSDAGPTAPEAIGAQLGHQPTPGSVKRADENAKATF